LYYYERSFPFDTTSKAYEVTHIQYTIH
jgi:hypothetical protein